MAPEPHAKDFRQRMQRLEGLIQEIELFPQAELRERIKEIVRTLLEVHGAGLEIILGRIADSAENGTAMIDALAEDELVGSLLLLHGLHPLDTETRVLQALEKVRPYLHSHGGNVEYLGFIEGVVRLRMVGSCHSCPSSAITLKTSIEEAVYQQAPDIAGIEVEGVTQPSDHGPAEKSTTFVSSEQLSMSRRAPANGAPRHEPAVAAGKD